MKKRLIIWTTVLVLLTVAHSASAFSIGVMGPDPTALTMRTSPRTVIDFGWYFGIYSPFYGEASHGAILFIADYWLAMPRLADPLSFYAGIGARIDLILGDPAGVGAALRIPLGFLLEIPFGEVGLEFFLEFPPTIGLFPGLGVGIDPAAGVRFAL